MKVEKKVISNLNKCYSMSRLTYKGESCFLVGAEKHLPAAGSAECGIWHLHSSAFCRTSSRKMLLYIGTTTP